MHAASARGWYNRRKLKVKNRAHGKPPAGTVIYDMPAIYDGTADGIENLPLFLIASLRQSADVIVRRKELRLRSNPGLPWPREKLLVSRSKTVPVFSGVSGWKHIGLSALSLFHRKKQE
jgi:hypothetical protein